MSCAVRLRPLALDDLDRIHAWHNDASLYETLTGTCRHPGRDVVRRWLEERIAATDAMSFAIGLVPGTPASDHVACSDGITTDSADERHIGNLYLGSIGETSTGTREAEFEMFLGSSQDRGRGIGRRAAALALTFAFETLELDAIVLHVLADNEPAIRVYRACGFVEVGDLHATTDDAGKAKVVTMRCRRP